jgi:hypothetical protein
MVANIDGIAAPSARCFCHHVTLSVTHAVHAPSPTSLDSAGTWVCFGLCVRSRHRMFGRNDCSGSVRKNETILT